MFFNDITLPRPHTSFYKGSKMACCNQKAVSNYVLTIHCVMTFIRLPTNEKTDNYKKNETQYIAPSLKDFVNTFYALISSLKVVSFSLLFVADIKSRQYNCPIRLPNLYNSPTQSYPRRLDALQGSHFIICCISFNIRTVFF